MRREREGVWSLEVEMRGELATPWPEKRTLSGEEWINPEGDFIQVPFIESRTTLQGEETGRFLDKYSMSVIFSVCQGLHL